MEFPDEEENSQSWQQKEKKNCNVHDERDGIICLLRTRRVAQRDADMRNRDDYTCRARHVIPFSIEHNTPTKRGETMMEHVC